MQSFLIINFLVTILFSRVGVSCELWMQVRVGQQPQSCSVWGSCRCKTLGSLGKDRTEYRSTHRSHHFASLCICMDSAKPLPNYIFSQIHAEKTKQPTKTRPNPSLSLFHWMLWLFLTHPIMEPRDREHSKTRWEPNLRWHRCQGRAETGGNPQNPPPEAEAVGVPVPLPEARSDAATCRTPGRGLAATGIPRKKNGFPLGFWDHSREGQKPQAVGTPEAGVQAKLGGLGVGLWVKNVSGHPFERFGQAISEKKRQIMSLRKCLGWSRSGGKTPDRNPSETPCAWWQSNHRCCFFPSTRCINRILQLCLP